MKYLLKTTYPCLVKTMDNFCEMERNDTLKIENEKVVFIYPQDDYSLPFAINLSSPKENRFFSILNCKGEKLLILEEQDKSTNLQKETLYFFGKPCTIEVSNKKVIFENDKKQSEFLHKSNLKGAKIFKLNNFACLQSEHEFFAFHAADGKLSYFYGDEIKLDNNTLQVTKRLNDSESREKVSTFLLDDKIETKSQSFHHNGKQTIKELVPFKLMESVKVKDFDYAFNCLADDLKEKLDQAQIEDFFGNFSQFLPLSTTEFITVSKDEKNYIKIDLENNKVKDISIDKL